MKLSLQRIARSLEKELSLERGTFDWSNDQSFEQCALYDGNIKGETLYVADIPIPGIKVPFILLSEKKTKSKHALCVSDVSLESLFNHIQKIFLDFQKLERELLRAVLQRDSVQTLVDLVTPFFDNEIIIMNSDFITAAHSYPELELLRLAGLNQLGPEGDIPLELANFFRNDTIYQNVAVKTDPFYYDPSIFTRRVLCINVFLQNEYASRIVLCEISHTIEACDEDLLVFFSEFVKQLYYQMGTEGQRISESQFINLIYKLLRGDEVRKLDIDQGLNIHGWKADDQMIIYCIHPDPNEPHVKSLPYYATQISSEFEETIVVVWEDSLCALTNLSKCHLSEEDFVRYFSEYQREANFRVGYSEPFGSLEEVPYRFRQAEIALRVGMTYDPMIWNHRFANCRKQYFQYKLTEELPGRYLVSESIRTLQKYDEENNTEYISTLRAYLDNHLNVVKTAELLYIHRATMIYRIKRMREIAQIDFRNKEQVFYLQMCLELFVE